MAMRTEDMCDVCATVEHCTHHGRCLAECLPSDLAAPVGDPAATRCVQPDVPGGGCALMFHSCGEFGTTCLFDKGEPAAMPPEMPEIQVGDVVMFPGGTGEVYGVDTDYRVRVTGFDCRQRLRDVTEIRKANGVIMRLTTTGDRKEPSL